MGSYHREDVICGYDIIGDVHGHYDQLELLLRELGYRETDGAWRHPGRQAIYVANPQPCIDLDVQCDE